MERYTHKDGDGNYVIDGEELFEDQCEDYCGPAAERLAAYEDTGFTPQEIKSLHGEWNANRSALDYARAERNAVTRRMIELEQIVGSCGKLIRSSEDDGTNIDEL